MERIRKLYNNSIITFCFLLIMIIYFIFISLNGGTTNVEALIKYGAFFPPSILLNHEYYRFITSIFIHIGIMHLFFNGYALYIFGQQIERLLGPVKYLTFFLLTGIGGNLVTYIFNFRSQSSFLSVSAGASGGLFGLFGAFLYLIHRHRDMVTPQGRSEIIRLLLINLLITVLVPSISTSAHLGGLFIGYLLSYIYIK